MVSTQDSESCDPSSNLGRTYVILLLKHLVSFDVSYSNILGVFTKTMAAVGFEPTPPRRLVP